MDDRSEEMKEAGDLGFDLLSKQRDDDRDERRGRRKAGWGGGWGVAVIETWVVGARQPALLSFCNIITARHVLAYETKITVLPFISVLMQRKLKRDIVLSQSMNQYTFANGA